MFIKYEAEVSSRVGGGERGVVDFGKLAMSRNSVLEEFRVRRFAVIQRYCSFHGLLGSASPVLTATGFVNGRGQYLAPTDDYGISDAAWPITIVCSLPVSW